jgi:hypothetical protein
MGSQQVGQQIIAFFAIRKTMIDESPVRECLGIEAAQEFICRHENITTPGKNAALDVERRFIEICERAGFAGATRSMRYPRRRGSSLGHGRSA